MKIKNKTVYSEDRDKLQFLADELRFIGREYKLNLKEGYVIQYALPPRKYKKPVDKNERFNRQSKE